MKRIFLNLPILFLLSFPLLGNENKEKTLEANSEKPTKHVLFIPINYSQIGLGYLFKSSGKFGLSIQSLIGGSGTQRTVINSGPCDFSVCSYSNTGTSSKILFGFDLYGVNSYASLKIGYMDGYRITHTEYLKLPYYSLATSSIDNNLYRYTFVRNPSPVIELGGGRRIFSSDGIYLGYEVGLRIFTNNSSSRYAEPTWFNVFLGNPPPNLLDILYAQSKIKNKVTNYEFYLSFQIGMF